MGQEQTQGPAASGTAVTTRPPGRQRIVVAMSGGVDSSTVAGLLCEQGHQVIGVAMKTHRGEVRGARACCTPDDMRDARCVADFLQIPFYVLDYADVFDAAVIAPFADAYLAGQTPNPCIACNDKVKFQPLLQRARALQADALATGHYARIAAPDPAAGLPRLLQRGIDADKDQSYFLYRLDPATLGELRFPLGNMTKQQVRQHARRLGLPAVADKPDSQEICFVGREGYARVVEQRRGLPPTAGNIVDAAGNVLGHHCGVHHFTVGQRRGLGLTHDVPQYVTHLDADRQEVQVGPAAALQASAVILDDVHWVAGDAALQRHQSQPLMVAQRSGDGGSAARVEILQQAPLRLKLHFLQPQRRGAPGQAAVLFGFGAAASGPRAAQRVLGGGTLAATPRQRALRVLSPASRVTA